MTGRAEEPEGGTSGRTSSSNTITTGFPAIFVYPITSGILTDPSSVIPAITSFVSHDRSYGRMLPRIEM